MNKFLLSQSQYIIGAITGIIGMSIFDLTSAFDARMLILILWFIIVYVWGIGVGECRRK